MFRNPRENANPEIELPVKPSLGRPPTPPNAPPSSRIAPTLLPMSLHSSPTKPLTPRPNSKSNVPTLGRQASRKAAASKTPVKNAFKAPKPNASILSFFRKVDGPSQTIEDGDMFIRSSQDRMTGLRGAAPSKAYDEDEDDLYDVPDTTEQHRYNELGGSNKRRRLSSDYGGTEGVQKGISDSFGGRMSTPGGGACTPPPPEESSEDSKPRRIGAFVDDSDSDSDDMDIKQANKILCADRTIQKLAVQAEEEVLGIATEKEAASENAVVCTKPTKQEDIVENAPVVPDIAAVLSIVDQNSNSHLPEGSELSPNARRTSPTQNCRPILKQEETSYSEFSGFDDVDDMEEDYMDDEYADGEEFVERKWMQEQARLEALDGQVDCPGQDLKGKGIKEYDDADDLMTEACPICSAKLAGISAVDISKHVNACLDGNPIPIPTSVSAETQIKEIKLMPANANTRFSRSAIPRPGQANPFDLGQSDERAGSAFSKIMASKAEDMAWSNAAAAEHASRGKPAYQRTCPFYKIMPGFFICVDAFRYGAVQGCNAYFLSHFHSDHYVGLTSTWCHGPIYCSKVTGNLVKQQLRVDPKHVVQIDFEERIEVPGTQGVFVTMIPANHCPGSSLYLFEKVTGKGPSPKLQRVLHCGDFRACPAHIAHPLLMPDIVDSITGKTKQQKIDVCYLDTTYLNPRYAFPCQEDVIKACADMCVSLSKDRAEENDAWETVKRERAGAGMAKFIDSTKIKQEDDSIAMTITPSEKPRGRLLVICGTYSIGKERICMGIARALDCKIWAAPGKQRICAALEDPELMARMTDDPREAQIHMQMLMEIRAETLQDYLNGFKPHFTRVVGFRPSGWNYRPPNSRFVDSPLVSTVLNSENWRSKYHMSELVPQRGSTKEASCFGVPYSEHSSFRELTMFCCALRIEKIIPTVNVGSAPGRAKMKAWIERWLTERRKNGPIKIGNGQGEVKW